MGSNLNLAITKDSTIREAMQRLDQTAEKCLFVVDAGESLIGALTDGDVRRAILSGQSLDEPIDGSYNTSPIVSYSEEPETVRKLMHQHKVEVVPVIDGSRRITQYVTWTSLFGDGEGPEKPPLRVPVVIMAGGYGTRLEPFTKVLPKPLIPVHEKPIIEHIIDRFVDVGANDFWLTVNYKSRIMKAYFHDREPDYTVHFVDEPEPMGTAGSLQFLRDNVDSPFFVTNCDIIINADYRQIMAFHQKNGHAVTLVGSAVHYQIPYGTCVLNDTGALARIDEKPRYDFIVNTGMYVVSPEVLEFIPESGVYDMTHLIADVAAAGNSVGVFPVSEDAWIDVGQWKEYQRAADQL